MLSISALFIYPIKSLGGIPVPAAAVTDRGLKYDRRWMLVDEDDCFLTQRELHEMALLTVAITAEGLVVGHKHNTDAQLIIPSEVTGREHRTVTIWSNRCKAHPVSSLADEWFSQMLSKKCRLVYMPDESRRRVDTRYASNKEITNFSDGYPFLIIGQASLDDLNSRLQQPVPMDRFRPNIVFTGGTPFLEDNMKEFVIANVRFFGVKRSGRCVITNIDQETGAGSKEPLRTLASYRTINRSVCFGQNLVHAGEGVIKVGDTITVISHA